MPIKEAEIRVRAAQSRCEHCGHHRVLAATRPQGLDQIWFAFCEACLRVQERVEIPGWFPGQLPPCPPRPDAH